MSEATAKGDIMFPRVRFYRKGYQPKAVDEFLHEAREAYEGGIPASEFSSGTIHKAMFPLTRGGYDPVSVDAALDRLEAAFLARDRADHVAVNGEQAWLDHVADRATTLYPRLVRPEGERFANPAKGAIGYQIEAVDAFMDRLAAFFDDEIELRVDSVRTITFPPAKGQDAYLEGPVDAYLARVIEILLAVE
ncbi:MAG: DivIVA domain-containing protein [Actinomycetaceae bacterium]|nr:DivIVA domain-containing protein [Actinomycetaceae bacterium]